MSLLTTDAVVLHAFDYLENSRIVRLATRDAGIQSVLARGARSSKKRFGTALDLFVGGVAQLQLRAGRELHTLSQFDLTEARHGLSLDLGRFAAASALAELGLRFGSAEVGDSFFDVLVEALDGVAGAEPGGATDAGLAGAWALISSLGFAPALLHCASCHDTVDDGTETVTFSHAAGGVVCQRCVSLVPRGRTIPSDARATLIAWTRPSSAPRSDVIQSSVRLPNEATRRAHLRLLREFLERHLSDGRELRAFEAWERAALSVAGGAGA